PESIGFAAGASSRFEPVLLVDNWPHPHGVVPSHLALPPLAYYQPRFTEQSIARTPIDPLFVLDRPRLSPYFEGTDRLDNRYYAHMPPLTMLAKDGIRGLFYVVASTNDLPEPSDLNAVLAADHTSTGITVKALALSDFDDDSGRLSAGEVYYGGSAATDASF